MTKDVPNEPGKNRTPSPESNRLTLSVHLAEYSALMSRNTSLMHWQWLLIPAVVVFLSFTSNVWTRLDPRLLAWGALGAVQAAMVLAGFLGLEHYKNIVYIETDLRSSVEAVLDRSEQSAHKMPFWGYEDYLAKKRERRPMWWEWATVPIAMVFFVVIAFTRPQFTWGDRLGLAVNLLIFAMLIGMIVSMRRLRTEWSNSLKVLRKEGTGHET